MLEETLGQEVALEPEEAVALEPEEAVELEQQHLVFMLLVKLVT